MNKLYLFALIVLTCSCIRPVNESELSNTQIKRYDQFLSQRIENMLIEFDQSYALNPEVTRPWHQKARQIHTLVTNAVYIIENDSILQNDFKNVSDLLRSFENELTQLNIERKLIDTLNMRHVQYWITKKIKSPISINYSTAISLDLKILESEILEYLFKQIGSTDYCFNYIQPYVIESDNTVKIGQDYEAKICMIAFDTTRYPEIKVNDMDIPIIDGFGVYRSVSNNPGKKTLKGSIIYQRRNCTLDTIPFTHTFFVK